MNWTNEQIIHAIKGSPQERNAALRRVFLDEQLFAFVRNHIGNEQDAKDVFQETLVLFDRNVRSGAFRGQSHWRTYFIGIAKWYWLDQRRKKDNNLSELKPEQYDGEATEHPEILLIAGERRALLEQAIGKLQDNCREILGLYMLSFSMVEIAEKTGSTETNVKKAAQRCRDRLRDYLLEHPDLMHILTLKTART